MKRIRDVMYKNITYGIMLNLHEYTLYHYYDKNQIYFYYAFRIYYYYYTLVLLRLVFKICTH